ncbi:MAG: LIC11966 family surface protein [Lishizhenia sp.]
MNKIKMTLVALLIIVTSTTQAQNAVDHMNAVLDPMTEFKTETWQYLKAVTKGKGARKVDAKRQKLITEISGVKSTVKREKAYNGDESLKNAVLEFLDLNYKVLKEDYDEILNMEEIAEQSYDLMEAYLTAQEQASQKLNEASDKLQAIQKTFAENNNINLIEGEQDKTSAKIQKAAKALEYYNDIYLVFFKVYKQEMYVLDAQSRNDVVALEQNINTLKIDVEEANKKLSEMMAYEGDKSLIVAAEKAVSFYAEEANDNFETVLNFYLTKDKYDKTVEEFNAISKKKRTQKDIDTYNGAINDYNKSVNEFNDVNESANKGRSSMFDDWNKAIDKFFSTHS